MRHVFMFFWQVCMCVLIPCIFYWLCSAKVLSRRRKIGFVTHSVFIICQSSKTVRGNISEDWREGPLLCSKSRLITYPLLGPHLWKPLWGFCPVALIQARVVIHEKPRKQYWKRVRLKTLHHHQILRVQRKHLGKYTNTQKLKPWGNHSVLW